VTGLTLTGRRCRASDTRRTGHDMRERGAAAPGARAEPEVRARSSAAVPPHSRVQTERASKRAAVISNL
jgi:hypothetical protein